MIGLIDKIKDHVAPGIYISDYCLNTIRLKKLLEQSRRLITLFDDGKEKSKGEYVFDFQYVVNLGEEISETLGKIVFNASVIVYAGSDSLYTAYDRHKKMSKSFIRSAKGLIKANKADEDTAVDLLAEPEYGLLKMVTDWFDNSHQNNHPSIKSFMADIFCHVFNAPLNLTQMEDDPVKVFLPYNGIINEICTTGLYGTIDGGRGIDDCRPFVLLKMQLSREKYAESHEKWGSERTWIAVYDIDYMSLNYCVDNQLLLKVVCLYSGYPDSDFIFIYSNNSIDLSEIVPDNMNLELYETGNYAWCYNRPISEIEVNLVAIGQKIFGPRNIAGQGGTIV